MVLPEGFRRNMRELLGEEADSFFKAMEEEPKIGVRLNSRKPGASFEQGRRVKWNPNAFVLNERPEFIFDPLFHGGAYYVQEPSSTIYETLTRKIVEELGGGPLNVIDVCAAPGGKTTAMINALPDGSNVAANEFVEKRAVILKENLIKWGYPQIKVTNLPVAELAKTGNTFDIVAVDVPCSGEGMMRKEPVAVSQWSEQLIEQCCGLQREILKDAVDLLKPGGFLIYSTCTFNRHENEENAKFIKETLGLIPYDAHFPEDWGISSGFDIDFPVYRFIPHKTEGEGLFLAVFRKEGKWMESYGINLMENPIEGKRKDKKKDKKNIRKEESKNKRADDDRAADDYFMVSKVLSVDFDPSTMPGVDLSLPDALNYLRGESIRLPDGVSKGEVVVKYRGLPLGLVKNIGARANNLYPKPWRIKRRLNLL